MLETFLNIAYTLLVLAIMVYLHRLTMAVYMEAYREVARSRFFEEKVAAPGFLKLSNVSFDTFMFPCGCQDQGVVFGSVKRLMGSGWIPLTSVLLPHGRRHPSNQHLVT